MSDAYWFFSASAFLSAEREKTTMVLISNELLFADVCLGAVVTDEINEEMGMGYGNIWKDLMT